MIIEGNKVIANVLIRGLRDQVFKYAACKEDISVGSLVKVPLKSKTVNGIVLSIEERKNKESKNQKSINQENDNKKGKKKEYEARGIVDVLPIRLPDTVLKFLIWSARYTMNPIGKMLDLFLPKSIFEKIDVIKEIEIPKSKTITLSEEQNSASETIKRSFGKFNVFVLDGVTGSGKTEVYLNVLNEALANGGQALIMLPELVLTSQSVNRFEKYFGFKPFVWNSSITPAKKRKTWQYLISGKPSVVIGARSALFLPFSNLSIIIVDEEHDTSYKQNESPTYNARDLAIMKSKIENIPIILSSATPSLETMLCAQNGPHKKEYYHMIKLSSRYGEASLPTIEIVDMQKEKGLITKTSLDAITRAINKNEQVLIYMNKRGYAPIRICASCGFKSTCNKCSIDQNEVALVYHTSPKTRLICHYCGTSVFPENKCKECGVDNKWRLFGPGIEKIFNQMKQKFIEKEVVMISSDSIKTQPDLIKRVENNEIDIMIGTQILAKGHHFPNLSTVVVLDADMGLVGGNLRGVEKTYQMLHQVSGRAGREGSKSKEGNKPKGRVIIQTHNPDHPMIEALLKQDRDMLYEYEMSERERQKVPPFERILCILIESMIEQKLLDTIRVIMDIIYDIEKNNNVKNSDSKHNDVEYIGPIPSTFYKIGGMYRYRLFLKSPSHGKIEKSAKELLSRVKISKNIKIKLDMDPYDFL